MHDLAATGRWRAAWAAVGSASGASEVGSWLAARLLWLLRPGRTQDPVDLLATIEAEDRFDVTDRLGAVTAPTLVIGGERDGACTARRCSERRPSGSPNPGC